MYVDHTRKKTAGINHEDVSHKSKDNGTGGGGSTAAEHASDARENAEKNWRAMLPEDDIRSMMDKWELEVFEPGQKMKRHESN